MKKSWKRKIRSGLPPGGSTELHFPYSCELFDKCWEILILLISQESTDPANLCSSLYHWLLCLINWYVSRDYQCYLCILDLKLQVGNIHYQKALANSLWTQSSSTSTGSLTQCFVGQRVRAEKKGPLGEQGSMQSICTCIVGIPVKAEKLQLVQK